MHCTACDILQERLDEKKIVYDIVDDELEVIGKAVENNIVSAPFLEVDDKVMSYKQAINWIKEH